MVSCIQCLVCVACLLVLAPTASFADFPSPLLLSTINGSNGVPLHANSTTAEIGVWLVPLGDVNDDTRPDFFVGGTRAAYVLFGRASAAAWLPSPLWLPDLDGTTGFALAGLIDASAGIRGSALGDVNGDNIDDFIVSSGDMNVGYVVFGRSAAWPATVTVSELTIGEGVAIEGSTGGRLGNSVCSLGDLNGDGIDDVVIGSPHADKVTVIFGTETWPATFNTSAVNGANGFTISGTSGDGTGTAVANVGNVGGDGRADLAISSPAKTVGGGSGHGRVSVVYGRTTWPAVLALDDLDGSDGFHINGPDIDDDTFGTVLEAGGDINGDAVADILIGAPGQDGNFGAAYVFFSPSTWPLETNVTSLNGMNGFRLQGDTVLRVGFALAPAGDLTGDGMDEWCVTAPIVDEVSGITLIAIGAASYPAVVQWSDIEAELPHLSIVGSEAEASGAAVHYVGDVTGDGTADLLVGAIQSEAGGVANSGTAYLIFGDTIATQSPTMAPTSAPTRAPTLAPTTESPTTAPTLAPTTESPTTSPTLAPTTASPTTSPTLAPTTTSPTTAPTQAPTSSPTKAPTIAPTNTPTGTPPTPSPTQSPTHAPSVQVAYVFVTSIKYSGALGGIDGADDKCQALADAGSPVLAGRTFRAWLSTSGSDSPALSFVRSVLPYILVDGTRIADNWDDLVDGALLAPINLTESGGAPPGPPAGTCSGSVRTNTLPNGEHFTGSGSACAAWTTTATNSDHLVGRPFENTTLWTNACTSTSCSALRSLYCFEQPATDAPTVAPTMASAAPTMAPSTTTSPTTATTATPSVVSPTASPTPSTCVTQGTFVPPGAVCANGVLITASNTTVPAGTSVAVTTSITVTGGASFEQPSGSTLVFVVGASGSAQGSTSIAVEGGGCATIGGDAVVSFEADPSNGGEAETTGALVLVTADCVRGKFGAVSATTSFEGDECVAIDDGRQDVGANTISASFSVDNSCKNGSDRFVSTLVLVGICVGGALVMTVTVAVAVKMAQRARHRRALGDVRRSRAKSRLMTL